MNGSEPQDTAPVSSFFVDILPTDFVRIAVNVLRQDLLSHHQSAMILEEAARSVLRQSDQERLH